jgi:hypothetical protein
MAKRNGGVWQERQTRDWFWIEKKPAGYFSSNWITCAEAVRIIRGQKPKPQTCHEVHDLACFEPVPAGVIKLLTKTMDKLKQDRVQ